MFLQPNRNTESATALFDDEDEDEVVPENESSSSFILDMAAAPVSTPFWPIHQPVLLTGSSKAWYTELSSGSLSLVVFQTLTSGYFNRYSKIT